MENYYVEWKLTETCFVFGMPKCLCWKIDPSYSDRSIKPFFGRIHFTLSGHLLFPMVNFPAPH